MGKGYDKVFEEASLADNVINKCLNEVPNLALLLPLDLLYYSTRSLHCSHIHLFLKHLRTSAPQDLCFCCFLCLEMLVSQISAEFLPNLSCSFSSNVIFSVRFSIISPPLSLKSLLLLYYVVK